MNKSESINEISTALSKAQGSMKPASKDAQNPHFKSKFSSLSAVWESIRIPLSSNGLTVLQDLITLEKSVSVTTVISHSSGQWIEFGPLCVPMSKLDAQGVGSASSYAKRYALCAALGITSDDDDDAETAVGRGKSTHDKQEKPSNNVLESHNSSTLQSISKEKLDQFMSLENQIDEVCRKNMNSHLLKEFDITPKDYHFMNESAWLICMKAMNRNIEMNSKKAMES